MHGASRKQQTSLQWSFASPSACAVCVTHASSESSLRLIASSLTSLGLLKFSQVELEGLASVLLAFVVGDGWRPMRNLRMRIKNTCLASTPRTQSLCFGLLLALQGGLPWPRLALKLVPCDHLDDKEAANAAATTMAEAGEAGGTAEMSGLRAGPAVAAAATPEHSDLPRCAAT